MYSNVYGKRRDEEVVRKTINSRDLVKSTRELLEIGSGGSQVCKAVGNEINSLIVEKDKNQIKYE